MKLLDPRSQVPSPHPSQGALLFIRQACAWNLCSEQSELPSMVKQKRYYQDDRISGNCYHSHDSDGVWLGPASSFTSGPCLGRTHTLQGRSHNLQTVTLLMCLICFERSGLPHPLTTIQDCSRSSWMLLDMIATIVTIATIGAIHVWFCSRPR